MFRSVDDFLEIWSEESAATVELLSQLKEESLTTAVSAEDRSLGRMAWHLAGSIPKIMAQTGLEFSGSTDDEPVPEDAAKILALYQQHAESLAGQLHERWTDASLKMEDDMYGMKWKRGQTLLVLLLHQAHHRGQMVVLMRQAGLKVPGIYGPSRDG